MSVLSTRTRKDFSEVGWNINNEKSAKKCRDGVCNPHYEFRHDVGLIEPVDLPGPLPVQALLKGRQENAQNRAL